MHRRNLILESLGFKNHVPFEQKIEKSNDVPPSINERKEEVEEYNPRNVFNNIIELTYQKLKKGETKKMRKKEVIDQLKEYFELNLPVSRDDPKLFDF